MDFVKYKCSACGGSKASSAVCDCRCVTCGGTGTKECYACRGKGRELLGLFRCTVCKGSGNIACDDCNSTGAMAGCPRCSGSGRIPCAVCTGSRRPCATCGRIGVIEVEESTTVVRLPGNQPIIGGGGVGVLFDSVTTRSEFLNCEHCGTRTSYPDVIV